MTNLSALESCLVYVRLISVTGSLSYTAALATQEIFMDVNGQTFTSFGQTARGHPPEGRGYWKCLIS